MDVVIKDQNILGTPERLNKFLSKIDENIRGHFKEAILLVESSEDRWKAFLDELDNLKTNVSLQFDNNLITVCMFYVF